MWKFSPNIHQVIMGKWQNKTYSFWKKCNQRSSKTMHNTYFSCEKDNYSITAQQMYIIAIRYSENFNARYLSSFFFSKITSHLLKLLRNYLTNFDGDGFILKLTPLSKNASKIVLLIGKLRFL